MMADASRIRESLASFEFKKLFIEDLGWDKHQATLQVDVDGFPYVLNAVVEKPGVAVFVCGPDADGRIPDRPTLCKIERQVTKSAHEHLIIFVDEKRTSQVWQWVRREYGKPAVPRHYPYHKGDSGDFLIQKIQALAVSLDEEELITVVDVTGRAKRAFDVEKVTKKFYELFKKEHADFLEFIEGIPDEELERWYASVMLNRLMFIYFIQKKGFLEGDQDYLKNKLAHSRRELGKDRYYLDFLCPLFFEGFAKREQERSKEMRALLGKVPYLNRGIFMPHQIERIHGQSIQVPDKAFEALFEFFDKYRWHLDERPLREQNEINPDVLGYIFEKYINQKQMGAYYTKEDITGYISKNTIIPFIFDAAREKCKVAFEGLWTIWTCWTMLDERLRIQRDSRTSRTS